MAGVGSARGGRADLLLGCLDRDVELAVVAVDGLVADDDLVVGLGLGLVGAGVVGLVVGLGLVGGAGAGVVGLVGAIRGGGAEGVLVDGLVGVQAGLGLVGGLGLVVGAHLFAELGVELGHLGLEGEPVDLEGPVETVDHVVDRALLDHQLGHDLGDDVHEDHRDRERHLLGELVVEQIGEPALVLQVADQEDRRAVTVLRDHVAHAVDLRRTAGDEDVHVERRPAGLPADVVGHVAGELGHPPGEAEAALGADARHAQGAGIDDVDHLQGGDLERRGDQVEHHVAGDGVDGLGAREGAQVADVAVEVVLEGGDVLEPHHQRAALVVGGGLGGSGTDVSHYFVRFFAVVSEVFCLKKCCVFFVLLLCVLDSFCN